MRAMRRAPYNGHRNETSADMHLLAIVVQQAGSEQVSGFAHIAVRQFRFA